MCKAAKVHIPKVSIRLHYGSLRRYLRWRNNGKEWRRMAWRLRNVGKSTRNWAARSKGKLGKIRMNKSEARKSNNKKCIFTVERLLTKKLPLQLNRIKDHDGRILIKGNDIRHLRRDYCANPYASLQPFKYRMTAKRVWSQSHQSWERKWCMVLWKWSWGKREGSTTVKSGWWLQCWSHVENLQWCMDH